MPHDSGEWCEEIFLRLSDLHTHEINKCSDLEKLVYKVFYCVGDCLNGYPEQMYSNSTGDYANEMPKLLWKIKAYRSALYFWLMNRLVFGFGQVPIDREIRSHKWGHFIEHSDILFVRMYRKLEILFCNVIQEKEDYYKLLFEYGHQKSI